MENLDISTNQTIFNSPLEAGLRAIIMLGICKPNSLDLQQLLYFDYLTSHANDIFDTERSLHANLPGRSSQIYVRRDLVFRGLNVMLGKGLIEKNFRDDGISYQSNDLSILFLDYLTSEYATELKRISKKMWDKFGAFSASEFDSFMIEQGRKWGTEYEFEAIFWEFVHKNESEK